MLIELILSIPARLSDLLVVLTSLMRPLVMALQEGQELVGLGLRTLEYWVDRCVCHMSSQHICLTCCIPDQYMTHSPQSLGSDELSVHHQTIATAAAYRSTHLKVHSPLQLCIALGCVSQMKV